MVAPHGRLHWARARSGQPAGHPEPALTHGQASPTTGCMGTVLQRLSKGQTVIVLFCDIADLPALMGRFGPEWPTFEAIYRDIVRTSISDNNGHLEDGDAAVSFGSFLGARDAVRAAASIQRRLLVSQWPIEGACVMARVALHAGVVGDGLVLMPEGNNLRIIGLDVHRGARVMTAANAGQVLVTETVRGLMSESPLGLEDLGLHRLRDFPDGVRLFHLDVDKGHTAAAFPPPKTLDYRPTNLTADERPLLGRDVLIGDVRAAFLDDRSRLITLTGPGGIGKTRVAIAAGSELLEEHRGGVWLIRAESLKQAGQLLPAIATIVGVADIPGRDLLDALSDRFQAAPALLVLDNLEQLAGVGKTISELLDRTVSLRILTTSQTPLHIDGETILPVSPLELNDAIELFRLRAPAVGATLDLGDAQTKELVTAIIELLTRLPLAIELAVAQLRNLTLAELSRSLDKRLDLEVIQSERPQRQQSLHAVIDWSVEALPAEPRQLFTRLGVFTGLTTLALIEEVCGRDIDVLEAAATLIDFSLLRRADIGFGMPPAVQQTAAELLAHSTEKTELRRLHASAMVKQAKRVSDINRIDEAVYKEGLGLEGNFRAAIDWAHRSDQQMFFDLLISLSEWWNSTGRVRFALNELNAALSLDNISDSLRAELLKRRAHHQIKSEIGSKDSALNDIREGLRLVGNSATIERAGLLLALAIVQLNLGDPSEAASTAALAAELFSQFDPELFLRTLCLQASALISDGDPAAAGPILARASELALLPHNQDTFYATSMLSNIKGDWALAVGEPLDALKYFATAVSRDEWSSFFLFHDVAGAILSLGRLRRFDSVIELMTALRAASEELGYDYSQFAKGRGWPDEILQTARASLAPAEVVDLQAHGRNISTGQLASRTLAIANEELAQGGCDADSPTSNLVNDS